MDAKLAVRAALVLILLVSGCGSQPETGTPAPAPASTGTSPNATSSTGTASTGTSSSATSFNATSFNGTDVMYLQMGIAQIAEGSQVVALATERATDPRVRALAAELAAQWREELGTMQRWLTGWSRPLTAPTGSHEGHGELHMLRPSDIGELRAATGETFDRTAVSLLLGHLGNVVETARMESAGGAYPPVKSFAETVTIRRQAQIQRLLAVAAEP
ncbi:hypothetical protein Ade02nite_35290 [Paractinoplanes deccanensis]|uniref:DUF305 domain-containing protein n=1 Tax=Paractinoplanes deccanensis TaxID=113561 RepID=A0ABQ3Y4I2_9ACTN|nr:DUF305 domain-containing protein [Actinoplanes deccanensis]GID74888.1 hypothetical protein Ade02nite_35290 [Actinoplanes deccanensis]